MAPPCWALVLHFACSALVGHRPDHKIKHINPMKQELWEAFWHTQCFLILQKTTIIFCLYYVHISNTYKGRTDRETGKLEGCTVSQLDIRLSLSVSSQLYEHWTQDAKGEPALFLCVNTGQQRNWGAAYADVLCVPRYNTVSEPPIEGRLVLKYYVFRGIYTVLQHCIILGTLSEPSVCTV